MSDLVEPVFLTHRPPPALRPYVTVAHGYRVSANPTGLHRGLPSRRLTLVVELAGPLGLSGLGAPLRAHGVVGGLHTCPALIDASQPQDGVQLALTPTGARALLGVPAGALGGLALDLVDLLGVGADRLVERMATARGWTARFAVLDEVLLAREWRALAGCSISTWLAEELPFVQDSAAADAPG